MIPNSIEEVLQYLELIDPTEAEYVLDMLNSSDVFYTFEHRRNGGLFLESCNDTFMICKLGVWSRISKEGTVLEISANNNINNAIYFSRSQHYCIIVGENFESIEEAKKKVPPL